MPAPITLTGRLMRLEPMCEDHLEPLLAAATEDRTSFGYTYVPKDRAAVRRYLDVAADDLRAHAGVAFATVDLRTGRVVGSTRFRELEYWNAGVWPPRHGHVNPSQVPDAAEIGSTWLVPGAHRTGINVEAKLLMLTHAFETWRVHRVSFKADTRNERSRTAILALGATFEGVRRAHFPASEGGVRDSALFSILSSEWQAAKNLLTARLARHGVQSPEQPADQPLEQSVQQSAEQSGAAQPTPVAA
ncbi:MAG TPA: GNAT family protein [Actinocrinis sp.]|uniref:GNAT family N-acetyltransferase n=1 Tax=Actinocrinis sp. TaxID=1920516 RepID=UPI002DDD4B14|nr:GNAT family protein [Actinocrinis sp.]HEV2343616.1 GNAT family protein [Actinocrinis sp.]